MALSAVSTRFLCNSNPIDPQSFKNGKDITALALSGITFAGVTILAVLILTGTYSFGLPTGVGTLATNLSWGFVAIGSVILLSDGITIIARLSYTPIDREKLPPTSQDVDDTSSTPPKDPPMDHLPLQHPTLPPSNSAVNTGDTTLSPTPPATDVQEMLQSARSKLRKAPPPKDKDVESPDAEAPRNDKPSVDTIGSTPPSAPSAGGSLTSSLTKNTGPKKWQPSPHKPGPASLRFAAAQGDSLGSIISVMNDGDQEYSTTYGDPSVDDAFYDHDNEWERHQGEGEPVLQLKKKEERKHPARISVF